MIGWIVCTVGVSWKVKERTWSSGGEGRALNEEGPVELENRSCRMGEKETKFSRCGGREMRRLLKGGDSV